MEKEDSVEEADPHSADHHKHLIDTLILPRGHQFILVQFPTTVDIIIIIMEKPLISQVQLIYLLFYFYLSFSLL